MTVMKGENRVDIIEKVKHDSKINGYGNLGKILVDNKGYGNDAVWWKSSKNKNVENADV